MTISPEEAQEIANKIPDPLPVYQDESGQIIINSTDQIVIKKLRPMIEADKGSPSILSFDTTTGLMIQISWDAKNHLWITGEYGTCYTNDDLPGWIPTLNLCSPLAA